MGITDSGFPLGIVGDHLAAAGGAWEPQRQYNWLITIAGIGQSAGGATGGAAGAAIGGSIGAAIGNFGGLGGSLGGALGNAIGNAVGGGGGAGGGSAIELALDSASLPTQMVEEIELNYLNERRYVAGRAVFEPIPLVVKDMVDVGVATACKTWFEQVHNQGTHKIGLARDYKKIADLILLSPEGSIERTWRLHGCWPTAINYGQLDMNSNDIVKIELNLRFDRAEPIGF